MTSLFSLNVSDVFDNVLHFQLFHNMKKKNLKQIVKMSEKLYKKQKHNNDY